jgi:hypothetical protein
MDLTISEVKFITTVLKRTLVTGERYKILDNFYKQVTFEIGKLQPPLPDTCLIDKTKAEVDADEELSKKYLAYTNAVAEFSTTNVKICLEPSLREILLPALLKHQISAGEETIQKFTILIGKLEVENGN